MRPGGIKGWEEFECVHASNELGTTTGSLCSIRVTDGEGGSVSANTTSMNEVLPCAGAFSQGFTPRCSKDTSVSPEGMQRLLESVPNSIRGCKGFGGTAGARIVVPPPMGRVYDLTQCDFQLVGMSAVFVRGDSRIFLTHGLELDGAAYAVAGILVVILVGCITQNIVHIIDSASRTSKSWIGVTASFASLVVVVSSMETELGSTGKRSMLVTHEDVVAYWYMVCYCVVRILVSGKRETYEAYTAISKLMRPSEKVVPLETIPLLPPPSDDKLPAAHKDKESHASIAYKEEIRSNHNLLATSLQLLSTRIHMTVSTPYTLIITALVGFRVFDKVYRAIDRQKNHNTLESIKLDSIMVVDIILFYILCLVGVLPQYSTSMEAYAGILTMAFACLVAARIMSGRRN